jgi:hypothetical protein
MDLLLAYFELFGGTVAVPRARISVDHYESCAIAN